MDLYCKIATKSKISKYLETKNNIVIASIDPGKVNFCMRVERRSLDINGNLYIDTLLYELININKKKYKDDILKFFNDNERIIRSIRILIIEVQLSVNLQMYKMDEFIDTYFRFRIYNLDRSKLMFVKRSAGSMKYSVFGIVTKGISTYKRKKIISPGMAKDILRNYGCYNDCNILDQSDKKDDFSDTVLLIESFLKTHDKLSRFYNNISLQLSDYL